MFQGSNGRNDHIMRVMAISAATLAVAALAYYAIRPAKGGGDKAKPAGPKQATPSEEDAQISKALADSGLDKAFAENEERKLDA